jgi:hypothetical protein
LIGIALATLTLDAPTTAAAQRPASALGGSPYAPRAMSMTAGDIR